MKVLIGYATNKGRYRKKNQDSVICYKGIIGKTNIAVACVCDGIGSFPNSEIAAFKITEGISNWFSGIMEYYPKDVKKEVIVDNLELTISELNSWIFQYRNNTMTNIGCTMSLLLVIDNEFFIFHVGDSRVYCLRNTLSQLTSDEVANKIVDGKNKVMLTNYVGRKEELWINKLNGIIEENDMFILGTDGFYKKMEQNDLINLKKAKKDSQIISQCEKLLITMMDRGEQDNLSCAVLFLQKEKRFLGI